MANQTTPAIQIKDSNVGIGTVSPANKLSINNGAFNVSSTTVSILNSNSTQKAHVGYDTFLIQQDDAPTLRLYETLENLSTTISSDAGLTSFATTGEMGLFVAGSNDAPGYSGLNGIQAVRIKSNGNVGIGTTSPSAMLTLNGTTPFIRIERSGVNTWQIQNNYLSTTNGFSINNISTGTTPFFIAEAGNVGIGTTSPSTKLDIGNTQGSGITLRYDGSSAYRALITPYWNSSADTRIDFSINRIANVAPDIVMSVGYNNNVGIGTTSPGQKLHIAESNTTSYVASSVSLIQPDGGANILIQNTGGGGFSSLRFVSLNGSNAIGYIGFNNSTASVGGDFVIGQRNGGNSYTEQVRITSSGNVGIGTTSPGYKLTVDGYIFAIDYYIQNSLGTNGTFRLDGYQDYLYIWGDSSSLAGYRFGSDTAGVVAQIGTNGNVGIGTTNPGRKLTVYDTTDVTNGQLRLGYNDDSYWDLGRDATVNGRFMFVNRQGGGSASELVSILPSGNVGIGTNSPSYKTVIYSNSSNTDVLCISNNQINGDSQQRFVGFTLQDQYANGSGNASAIRSYSNLYSQWGTTLTFSTTNNTGNGVIEKMRITANGNVGIGTTSPSEMLEVNGNVQIGSSVDAKLYMVSSGGNGYNERFFIEGYADGGTYGGGFKLSTRNDSNIFNTAVTVNRNGLVGIGTTSPGARLTVQTSTASSSDSLRITDGTGVINIGHWDAVTNRFEFSGKPTYFVQYGSGNYMSFGTNGSEAMRITSASNVGIGTTAPAAKLEVYGTGFTSGSVNFLVRNGVGTKIIESFDDGFIRLNNTLNINQAIYINIGNSNVHYALDSHIFNVVNDSYQRVDFVTIKGNLGKPAMGVGTMSPDNSAILDLTSRSKGFLPPRMTNTEMNAIASPAAGLVVYDTTNNKLTVYNGSTWAPLH